MNRAEIVLERIERRNAVGGQRQDLAVPVHQNIVGVIADGLADLRDGRALNFTGNSRRLAFDLRRIEKKEDSSESFLL